MALRTALLSIVVLMIFHVPVFGAQPLIEVAKSEFDFGTVQQGEKVTHVFRFINAGDAPLNIERVRSSCGCTVPRLSAEILAPGDVAEVEAVFDSTRFRGRVAKTIYLYTNDPLHEVVQLTLRGVVAEVISADPPRADFGVIEEGEEKTVTVRLSSGSDAAVNLGEVTVTNPSVRATLEEDVLEPGGETTLTLTAEPDKEHGRLSGYVIIPTSHENVPEIRLPIFGTVSPQ